MAQMMNPTPNQFEKLAIVFDDVTIDTKGKIAGHTMDAPLFFDAFSKQVVKR